MNRTHRLVSAFAAGIVAVSTVSGFAQTAPAPAPAAAPAAVVPQAIPAKIALIAFQQAVVATNEGQRSVLDVQKKYEPKKAQIDSMSGEVDSLKKQLDAAPATMTAEERASRVRAIDTKEKQLNRDAEDATTAYNTDLQEALGKVAQKVMAVTRDYCAKNGYTLLLDVGEQGSNVLWANQSTDISQAVVTAYNTTSGVAAPPPSAPTAPRRTAPAATRPPAR
jgi:Skp family chaperone for outer membrane proteins